MHAKFEELIAERGLTEIAAQIRSASIAAVSMELKLATSPLPLGISKLGGRPDLPDDFEWPVNGDRRLDFLCQIALSDASRYDSTGQLPTDGLLTFFYDLKEQPWGFDPSTIDGFRVIYTSQTTDLTSSEIPNKDCEIPECLIQFHAIQTLPHFGSRACESLMEKVELENDDMDDYFEFVVDFETLYSRSANSGKHRLLGNSVNIQGDMQLEAQLVSNGLYCGDASGYEDPRREKLEAGADDWVLLLQLDSDDTADMMWGDCGTLYYWIRRTDLLEQKFENVWMTMQCS